jgi:hypothetical protein
MGEAVVALGLTGEVLLANCRVAGVKHANQREPLGYRRGLDALGEDYRLSDAPRSALGPYETLFRLVFQPFAKAHA